MRPEGATGGPVRQQTPALPTVPERPAGTTTGSTSGPSTSGQVRQRREPQQGLPAGRNNPAGPAGAAPRQPLSTLATVGRTVANSAPALAAGAALQSVANALPQQQIGAMVTRLTNPQTAANAAGLRTALQGSLAALQTPDDQMAAHNAARAYGEHAGTVLDAAAPAIHKTLLVGLAGTSMAFGVGRNAGLGGTDAGTRAAQGQPAPGGYAGPATVHQPGAHTLAEAAARWAGGAAAGGVGNFVGQHLVAPLVNTIPRQHAPIDAKAVVPDEMRDTMNRLQPGSGDRLRAAVAAHQKEFANIASETNIHIGEAAFDVATGIKAAVLGTQAFGVGGTVAVGLAVSAAAGGAIGASMAVNAATAKIKVPDMAQLRNAEANGVALADVPKHDMPLFYTKHNQATGPVRAISTAWQAGTVGDPAPNNNPDAAGRPQTLGQRASTVVANTANIATSVLQRSARMMYSTTGAALADAATPFVAAGVAHHPALATAVRTAGAALGIHAAIRPWFNQLATGIPGADAQMRAGRQQAVNAAAASGQPPDVETGLLPAAGQEPPAAAGVQAPGVEIGINPPAGQDAPPEIQPAAPQGEPSSSQGTSFATAAGSFGAINNPTFEATQGVPRQ